MSEGLPGSAFAWRMNYPPRAQALVVTIEALMPNSLGALALPFSYAFDLGGVEGIELPSALTLLLRSDLRSARQRRFEGRPPSIIVDFGRARVLSL